MSLIARTLLARSSHWAQLNASLIWQIVPRQWGPRARHAAQRMSRSNIRQSTSTQYDSAHDTKHEGYITSSYTKETERECTDHLRWAREKNTSWPRTEQSTRVCRGSWKPKLFGTSPQSTPNAKYTCLVRISRWIHFCSKSLNKVVNHSTNWLNNS